MKVALIGPVPPFRSGIARHTDRLAHALAARGDVDLAAWSFYRQYPKVLFPGESDRDPAAAAPADYPALFLIDTVNPLSWRRAAAAIADTAPDLAVMPAWTFFTAPALGAVARALRARGVETVMIVHNAADHEGAAWKRVLSAWQLRAADRFVTHNQGLEAAIRRLGLRQPAVVAPHPVYDDYPPAVGALPRERGLELLCFGLVRPYKGVDLALAALAASGLQDVRLSVVGEFWSGLEQTQAQVAALGLCGRVEIVPRYVSDAEAAEYFHRADAVLAPYRAATGSGVVALAQHYGRPVIASDAPGLAEAVAHRETGWVFPVGDAPALAALLKNEVSRDRAAAMAPAIEAQRERLGWPRYAAAVLSVPAGK